MKLVKRCFLLAVTLAGFATANAQTVDEILAKHLDAIGGKEKLNGITSVRMESTMQVMGSDAPSTTVILNGKGYRNEAEFNGQQMVQVYTDKGGWAINPMAGSADAQAMPEEQYKAGQDQIYIEPFVNYAARGSKAVLQGREKVGTVDAYKVKLTNKDSSATTYYIDPTTYYIVQSVRSADMMGQQLDITTGYSNYKKTDYGWVVPQAMDINFGGQFSLTAVVNKVEVNKPVDASLFEMKK
ncbi:MAG TPA: hypothetical protein VM010_01380 [Chitinophagaceae bacterium]|nr:hypothetical protein [Chitinophagaceae bacterium]